ncbi:MAG: polyisoprenyl-teichoic acid--peptidoglycan teichoic acid transferase [Chloroflexota bacterium]|nr:polyisoprenyl-teichoic acid--peptidoglycan teichoic acid transferase [Chloroflexota bacterium]
MLLAVPVVLIGILGMLAVAVGGSAVASRLLDARILVAFIVLDVTLLGWRLIAILQAHGERSRLTFRRWPTWLTAGLVLLTIAMHALPAYYASKAIDTLGSVSLEGGGGLGGQAGRRIDVAAPSNQPDLGLGERITVLLVGIDFAPGRDQHLTDTMLVTTLDPKTGEGAMISVPRDLYGVPLGDGRVYNAKLNSLLATASADPETYPEGGPATLKGAIGALLGTTIHYFVAIDIEGLREVIDTIGGVDVTVERPISDPTYPDTITGQRGFYLDAGRQHLDGTTALGYARSRMGEGDSDFTRAERQQVLLTAIAEKLTAGNLVSTLPGLLDAVRDNVATDVPASRIPDLAAEVQDADLGDLEQVVLSPPEYVVAEADTAAGYILVPMFDAITGLGDRIFGTADDGGNRPTSSSRPSAVPRE